MAVGKNGLDVLRMARLETSDSAKKHRRTSNKH